MKRRNHQRTRFLIRNLVNGLGWLAGIILFFYGIQHFLDLDFEKLIEQYADRPMLVYGIFLVSEVVFGIIPPEVFMIWAAGSSEIASYPVLMAVLAIMSYSAGVIGYFIGRWIRKTKFYHFLEEKALKRYIPGLRRYGYFLIIVASLTPIPFSAVCMLVGAIKYPLHRFLIFAAFRFLRFTAYAWVMLHVSHTWFF